MLGAKITPHVSNYIKAGIAVKVLKSILRDMYVDIAMSVRTVFDGLYSDKMFDGMWI